MRQRLFVFLTIGFVLLPCSAEAQRPRSSDQAQTMFRRMDRDRNGVIDKREAPAKLKAMFGDWDQDSDGKLTRSEFESNFSKRRVRGAASKPGEYVAPAAKQERQPEALQAGDRAPDFTLPRVGGEGTVKLSELYRDKPVVLVFGSISCSPFRQRVQQVEQLYQQHKDNANFLMVYIREAHPDSKIQVKTAAGEEELQTFVQTNNLALRREHAATCERTLSLSFPTVMDGVDNRVNAAYAGWPIRLVVIDTNGRILDPGAPGPQGFTPDKVATWLKTLR
ncbi:type III iodothyronine deiodinase [Rhodopirellula maiorica SM1]|uniref:Type III iodothyronine deiodinase n=1 Tax=Rhodopirellula maiorica SM1 TaxID=1265738 RepID=M5RQL6_9BACT|nr:deiodinase-like protein [Rhodopirellula maiorica]EMI17677.1 type III iodothyronine deiodinase [Rhodopirellula maiorica SM1]